MYLYGASGHAKVIIDILKAMEVSVEGLFDDNKEVNQLLDYPVLHTKEIKGPLIISIGNNQIRKKIANKLSLEFGTAIHPSSIISPYTSVGIGTVVMHGAIIQSSTQIGDHCIINTGASVDHDCRIENFVHISPQAVLCGGVSVGEGSWIGAGSVVIPGLKIGKWSIIGAGSVVTKDIPDNVLAVGNRCEIIKTINNNE